MKRLFLALFAVVFLSLGIASVTTGPQCTPTVASGGGLPNACEYQMDPRSAAIQAFFLRYEAWPNIIFAAMAQYGVSYAELSAVMDYRLDIKHWMRLGGAPDGFAGLKVWSPLEIDQVLAWMGAAAIDDPQVRVLAQDTLDIAARRQSIYLQRGLPVPDTVAPWEHAPLPPPAPQPVQPCVDGVCVVTGP